MVSCGSRSCDSRRVLYPGQLTIGARQGTLVTNDLGVLDAAHLAFTETERPSSGTGVFANPGNSVFFISGSIFDNGQGAPSILARKIPTPSQYISKWPVAVAADANGRKGRTKSMIRLRNTHAIAKPILPGLCMVP
jgi:hypothetical protein